MSIEEFSQCSDGAIEPMNGAAGQTAAFYSGSARNLAPFFFRLTDRAEPKIQRSQAPWSVTAKHPASGTHIMEGRDADKVIYGTTGEEGNQTVLTKYQRNSHFPGGSI